MEYKDHQTLQNFIPMQIKFHNIPIIKSDFKLHI